MPIKRINYDYLGLTKEPLLLLRLNLRYAKKYKHFAKPKKILIVNPCLVGEFAVSLPAVRQFIKKTGVKADILVSPAVKSLAKKIRGIDKVFTVKSVYGGNKPKESEDNPKFKDYDFVLIMRISPEAYDIMKKIKFKSIRSYGGKYLKFIMHYTRNMIKEIKTPKWKDINFLIIRENPRPVDFDEIFDFKNSDYAKIKGMAEFSGQEKKILIHTNSAGWVIKRWSNNKWAELLNRINKTGNFKFIFIGGPGEEKSYEEIKNKLDFESYSLIGKIDLGDLALAMRLSNYFIGIDSGPMNLAHLSDLPTVGLFGPGQRNFISNNPRDVVISKINCKCTTLFCYRMKTCFDRIEVDDVFLGFEKIRNYKV